MILSVAKTQLQRKMYIEAIASFNDIMLRDADEAGEAAYCLGIIYYTGTGTAVNFPVAEEFFRIADVHNYMMGTYYLATMNYRQNKYDNAYMLYDKISAENPSAAYWTYRLASKNLVKKDDAVTRDKLNLAIAQGHVLAQRDLALSSIIRMRKPSDLWRGVVIYIRAIFNGLIAIRRNDKLRIQ